MTISNLFLLFLALSSALHISAIVLKKECFRRITKILLIPLLLGAYLGGTGTKMPLPALALVFGWLGDILLIKISEKRFFKIGLCSFLTGHILYIAVFIQALAKINVPVLAVSIAAAVLLAVPAYRLIRPDREMAIPVALYMAILESMSIIGLQLFFARGDMAGVFIFSGCLFFMLSDSLLAYFTFRPMVLWAAIAVMVFYILAQTGIILGLMRV
ncbi:MAG: lysoplasmalogenase [Treponema sp.]|jgi:uncharacterized membrane protein YhhN|nr:lysoplasmalogenase [Treponema sp.]